MNGQWVYIRSEPHLWTCGFYSPGGKFHTDSDHADREAAARRVAYLNGNSQELATFAESMVKALDKLNLTLADLVFAVRLK